MGKIDKSDVRLCICCEHCYYDTGSISTEVTPAEGASISCFKHEFYSYTLGEMSRTQFRDILLKAMTCPHFSLHKEVAMP